MIRLRHISLFFSYIHKHFRPNIVDYLPGSLLIGKNPILSVKNSFLSARKTNISVKSYILSAKISFYQQNDKYWK
jgi:hypothetical protein